MPSNEYQKFIKEYNSSGRAKGDGYSLTSLLRLEGEERRSAAQLLLEESKSFLPALEALVRIEPAVATKFLEDLLSSEESMDVDFTYWYWSWKFAPDACKARKIVDDMFKVRGIDSSRILRCVKEFPNYDFVITGLKKFILTNENLNYKNIAINQIFIRAGYDLENEGDMLIWRDTKQKFLDSDIIAQEELLDNIIKNIKLVV